MTFNREILNTLVKPRSKTAIEKARKRKDNRSWLRKSQQIALAISYYLRKNGMSQKELAEKMDVTPVYVGKLLKGQENLTLETISKIENALGDSLMSIVKPYEGIMIVSLPHRLSSINTEKESEKYVKTYAAGNDYSSFHLSHNIA